MVNDIHGESRLARGDNYDRNFETTSATAIVHLTAGDIVWVNLDKGIVLGHSAFYTTFSGYRIGPGIDGIRQLPFQSDNGYQSLKN